jgi:hypothetical protein
MRRFLRTRALDLPIAVIALATLVTEPAWAGEIVPGPVTGGLAGAAIVGAIVIAKLWRRK